MRMQVVAVLFFLILPYSDCLAASLPAQLCAIHLSYLSSELTADRKGGVVTGEVEKVTILSQDERHQNGEIQLKVTEVVAGTLQAPVVRVAYSRRINGLDAMQVGPWDLLEPQAGLRLVVDLVENKTDPDTYMAFIAFPLEPDGQKNLPAYRTIAAVMKIKDPVDRLAAIDRIELKKQPLAVQYVAVEQIGQYGDPSAALAKLTAILRDLDFDPSARREAACMIRDNAYKLDRHDLPKARDALLSGLRDPDAHVRNTALQLLLYKAAVENPYYGCITINPRVIHAIEQMLSVEKDADVRRRALELQGYIHNHVAKILSALP